MNPIRLLAAVFAMVLMSGCETVHYDYRAPTSDMGRMCVSQCAAVKEQCVGNEIQRAQREKSTCERSNDSNYRACMSKASNKDEEKECGKKRKYCSSSEYTERCERDYRMCFVNCGGRIIETRE